MAATKYYSYVFFVIISMSIFSGRSCPLPSIFKQSAVVAMDALSKARLDFSVNGTIEQFIADKMPGDKLAQVILDRCRKVLLREAAESIEASVVSSGLMLTSGKARDDAIYSMLKAGNALLECPDEMDILVNSDVAGILRNTLYAPFKCVVDAISIVNAIDSCLAGSDG